MQVLAQQWSAEWKFERPMKVEVAPGRRLGARAIVIECSTAPGVELYLCLTGRAEAAIQGKKSRTRGHAWGLAIERYHHDPRRASVHPGIECELGEYGH